MRRAIGGLLGLVCATGLLQACGDSSAFTCREDSQCVLAGEAGLCQPTSHCSYPDAECPSGYRYPVGAPNDLAGLCAGEGRMTDDSTSQAGSDTETSTTATTATSSTTSSTAATTGVGETSGDVSTSRSSQSSTAEATTDPLTSGPTSNVPTTTGSQECIQESDEANDTPERAPNLDACSFDIAGAIGGDDLDDYYFAPSADLDCDASWHATTVGMVDMVCIEYPCASENVGGCSGTQTTLSGWVACCEDGNEVTSVAGCGMQRAEAIYVHVRRDSRTCEQYELSVNAPD